METYKYLISLFFSIGLLYTSVAQATTTTLTFDDLAGPLTTQYQSLGVTTPGVLVSNLSINPPSFNKIAWNPDGLIIFNLDSSIMGDIHTVSAQLFISSQDVSIFAYDAVGALLGQSLISAYQQNPLTVSFLSSPIAKITILGTGGYAVDFISFSTESVVAVPEPETNAMLMVGLGLIGLVAWRRKQKGDLALL
jgi:hypothetical protein